MGRIWPAGRRLPDFGLEHSSSAGHGPWGIFLAFYYGATVVIMCNEMCIHNTLRLSTSYDKVEDLPVLRKCSAFSEYFENLPLFFSNFIGVGLRSVT